jgi:hypothetical protein
MQDIILDWVILLAMMVTAGHNWCENIPNQKAWSEPWEQMFTSEKIRYLVNLNWMSINCVKIPGELYWQAEYPPLDNAATA